MPYIGNTVQNQGFTPAIDYFSGNGVTVTFTLSRPIASVAQVICAIDNVIQNPSSAFTVSGNSITFTSAPLAGTNNIWVEYTSLITTYAAISQDPSVIGDITASGGYLSTGDFGNSYIDGVIVDYVTGNARLTTGPIDDMTFYHGGSFSRSEMLRLSYAGNSALTGNFGIGKTPSTGRNLELYGGTYGNMVLQNSTTGTGSTDGFLLEANGSDALIVNYESGNMRFYTSATERMRIDSSGRVTNPYQPCFWAVGSGTTSQSTSITKITLNGVGTNVGSVFNTSTSRFTAPVAGSYAINALVTWDTQGSAGYAGVLIYKNGSNYAQTYTQKPSGGYAQVALPLIITLSANDYIEIYSEAQSSGTVIELGRTSLSGQLIG